MLPLLGSVTLKLLVNDRLYIAWSTCHTVKKITIQSLFHRRKEKKMPFWLFISINWIVHRIGWSEPSEALKVTLSGNLPEVQTSSSASQEIATSHQKLLCNSASIISECLPSALQLAKGRGTKAQKSTGTHGSWQHLAWLQRAMLSRICVISADGWMPF